MNTLPKSERILIVGGTSGIGAAVAERLSARYAITIASRRLMKYPHFDQLAFDASDPGSIRAALGDSIFDHVVVTAADTPTGPSRTSLIFQSTELFKTNSSSTIWYFERSGR